MSSTNVLTSVFNGAGITEDANAGLVLTEAVDETKPEIENDSTSNTIRS